jgi:hypothetical protein
VGSFAFLFGCHLPLFQAVAVTRTNPRTPIRFARGALGNARRQREQCEDGRSNVCFVSPYIFSVAGKAVNDKIGIEPGP